MSEQAIINHAKSILENPLTKEVLDRIENKLREGFRTGSAEIRAKICDIMDSRDTFFNELQIIVDEAKPINVTEGKILPLNR